MGFIINGDFLEKYTKEEGVTRAVIPEGVTQIGDEHSFGGLMDCRKVKTIHVPASVKRIRKDAFQYCSAKVTYEDKESIEFFEKKRF